jgi:hypothetical protein
VTAVELVYELRECVDFYVAAEDLSGYCWWVWVMGDICRTLEEDRPMECENVARLAVESILPAISEIGDRHPFSRRETGICPWCYYFSSIILVVCNSRGSAASLQK